MLFLVQAAWRKKNSTPFIIYKARSLRAAVIGNGLLSYLPSQYNVRILNWE